MGPGNYPVPIYIYILGNQPQIFATSTKTHKNHQKSSLISDIIHPRVPCRDLHGTIEGPSFGMEIQIWHGQPRSEEVSDHLEGMDFFCKKTRHVGGGQ